MFIDFYVRKCGPRLADVARGLGYSALVCEDVLGSQGIGGISIYRKAVLRESSIEKLRGSLARRADAISVEPMGLHAARWAVHDSRVDALILSSNNYEYFDKKQFRSMKRYGKPLEISLGALLGAPDTAKEYIYRRLVLASAMGVKLVIGSGASEWNELYHPRAASILLRQLFDIPKVQSILGMSLVPRSILASRGVGP